MLRRECWQWPQVTMKRRSWKGRIFRLSFLFSCLAWHLWNWFFLVCNYINIVSISTVMDLKSYRLSSHVMSRVYKSWVLRSFAKRRRTTCVRIKVSNPSRARNSRYVNGMYHSHTSGKNNKHLLFQATDNMRGWLLVSWRVIRTHPRPLGSCYDSGAPKASLPAPPKSRIGAGLGAWDTHLKHTTSPLAQVWGL